MAKGRILKTSVTRKQSTPNSPKNKHFLHHDTHICYFKMAVVVRKRAKATHGTSCRVLDRTSTSSICFRSNMQQM